MKSNLENPQNEFIMTLVLNFTRALNNKREDFQYNESSEDENEEEKVERDQEYNYDRSAQVSYMP